MQEMTMNEVGNVSGGWDIVYLSSAAGHVGRAFTAGYLLGSAIESVIEYLQTPGTGTSAPDPYTFRNL